MAGIGGLRGERRHGLTGQSDNSNHRMNLDKASPVAHNTKAPDAAVPGVEEMRSEDQAAVLVDVQPGQAVDGGRRHAVQRTDQRRVEAVAMYPDRQQFRAEHPELDDEDIRQALEYAAANLDDRVAELRPAA